ncbi:MAG: type 1 glutamine amidotransferase [Alphaproteobacteria bacterium]|nr:type 1 glutamine amidotransferase [Alphaproteobacteria bacterium]
MKILAIMAGGMDGPVESGVIGQVVSAQGYSLDWRYRRHHHALPIDISDYAALIVFGGEISVHDPDLKPYFGDLSALIKHFYQAQKPILGSCLGSQAIAYAFGATVKSQGFLEYGFTSLTFTDIGQADPLLEGLGTEQMVFEMHSDTFDLPSGAELLMTGEAITNQAYRIGSLVYGFQCHFEVTPDIVRTWNERELIGNPNHDQDKVSQLIDKTEKDFLRFEKNQRVLAETLVSRWLNLINNGKEETTHD